MKLNKPYTRKQYADFAVYCTAHQCMIEDRGEYLEAVAIPPIEPTPEQTLIRLEQEYNMPRVIREGILGNPSAYGEFNVNRARDLEELAEAIRESKDAQSN